MTKSLIVLVIDLVIGVITCKFFLIHEIENDKYAVETNVREQEVGITW
jgi:hypothetical protein